MRKLKDYAILLGIVVGLYLLVDIATSIANYSNIKKYNDGICKTCSVVMDTRLEADNGEIIKVFSCPKCSKGGYIHIDWCREGY